MAVLPTLAADPPKSIDPFSDVHLERFIGDTRNISLVSGYDAVESLLEQSTVQPTKISFSQGTSKVISGKTAPNYWKLFSGAKPVLQQPTVRVSSAAR